METKPESQLQPGQTEVGKHAPMAHTVAVPPASLEARVKSVVSALQDIRPSAAATVAELLTEYEVRGAALRALSDAHLKLQEEHAATLGSLIIAADAEGSDAK